MPLTAPYGKFWIRESRLYPLPSPLFPKLHDDWPYFIEVDGSGSADNVIDVSAFCTAIYLLSDSAVEQGPTVHLNAALDGGPVIFERFHLRGGLWGHYRDELTAETLTRAVALQPKLSILMYPEKFSRLSTALRHYDSALTMEPYDIAQIIFTTVLESLFSQATQELSFRLALTVSWFLGEDRNERHKIFKMVKELYTVRSKSVHGARLEDDEETSAIVLAQHHVPRSELLARRCLMKIFDLGLDELYGRAKNIDDVFAPILLGAPLEEAIGRFRGG